jgi:hypothetical protein
VAIEELSADQQGLRLHVISLGAGLDAEALRVLLKYARVSSVYRLLNGEQEMTLPQMKIVARAAAGKREWAAVGWTELFYYLQGGKRLGFQDPPDEDGGEWVARESNPEPTDRKSVVLQIVGEREKAA